MFLPMFALSLNGFSIVRQSEMQGSGSSEAPTGVSESQINMRMFSSPIRLVQSGPIHLPERQKHIQTIQAWTNSLSKVCGQMQFS